jgi:hypothetical protein
MTLLQLWFTLPQPVGFGATTKLKKRIHNHYYNQKQTPKNNQKKRPHTKQTNKNQKETDRN